MNSAKEDVGVLQDYTFDLAFGSDENDFECKVATSNHVCEAGFYLYMEGTEYGGIVDSIHVDTNAETITYKGRTWHGILDSKILCPDDGEDYLVVSGEANEVLASLVARMGLEGLFKASETDSGINVSTYKMNRYIGGYKGIRKMLKASGAKLNVSFKEGFVELSARPSVNYAKDEQFDTDQIDFKIEQFFKPLNHVICLGKGELAEREVVHIYADAEGNVNTVQSITGIDERVAVYENTNAESSEELLEGGIEMLQESWNSSSVQWNFDSNEETYDVGDVVGAKEKITKISAASEIAKKIVTIKNNETTISYKVGE
jgi:hypothetical protein